MRNSRGRRVVPARGGTWWEGQRPGGRRYGPTLLSHLAPQRDDLDDAPGESHAVANDGATRIKIVNLVNVPHLIHGEDIQPAHARAVQIDCGRQRPLSGGACQMKHTRSHTDPFRHRYREPEPLVYLACRPPFVVPAPCASDAVGRRGPMCTSGVPTPKGRRSATTSWGASTSPLRAITPDIHTVRSGHD